MAADRIPTLPTSESDTLRGLLIAELGVKANHVAQRRAALVAEASHDPSGLERAMSVLYLFAALDEIDEIQAALSVLDDGLRARAREETHGRAVAQ